MSGHVILDPLYLEDHYTVARDMARRFESTAVGEECAKYADAVRALIELRREGARAMSRQGRESFEEWRKQQLRAAEQSEHFRRIEEALRGSLAILRSPGADAPDGAAGSAERGYVGLGQARLTPSQLEDAVNELRALLRSLPETFRKAAPGVYGDLSRHLERLAARGTTGERVGPDDVRVFREMCGRAVDRFLREATSRERTRRETVARVDRALDRLAFYDHLACSRERESLRALRSQFLRHLDNNAPPGTLGLLERRLETLGAEINASVIRSSCQSAVCSSLTLRLEDMGYETLEPFDETVEEAARAARFRVPGGEQIGIAVDPQGRIRCEFVHERPAGAGVLSDGELDRFATQEARWCGDLKELYRGLIAEGFSYAIRLEESMPAPVKMVVVESGDDLLEDAEVARTRTPRKRRLT